MPTSPAFVLATRHTTLGPRTETLHRVHVAVAAPDGAIVSQAGDADHATPLRSCLKPFQAQALVLSGAMERFSLDARHLALACASHDGARAHTDLVDEWLTRLSLGVTALQCGAHAPADKDVLADQQRSAAAPTPLHNNCSGKHTGMLSAALALGADPRHYLHHRHPVQALIRERLSAHASSNAPLAWGVDGCSAPTPVMPISELARLYARLIAAAVVGSGVDDPGLARCALAMVQHPELVGGRGVLDTRLMRTIGPQVPSTTRLDPLSLVAKRGADGVYAYGYVHPRLGSLGVALKVEDGSGEARAPAVLATLERLGALTPAARVALADVIRPERRNHRGLLVGSLEVELALPLP